MATHEDDRRERVTEISSRNLEALREAETFRAGVSEAARIEERRVPPLKVLEGYQFEQCIYDKGGEGIVDRYRHPKHENIIVVKYYPPRREGKAEPDLEVLERIRNVGGQSGIVKLFHYERAADGLLYEVMEYAKGGSLDEIEIIPSEHDKLDNLYRIILEVYKAILRLHHEGIVHRDIKPSNILFRKDNYTDLIIIDFGLSSIMSVKYDVRTTARAGGTDLFMAPDIFASRRSSRQVVRKEEDYYSLGMTILKVFYGDSLYEQYRKNISTWEHYKANNKLPIPEKLPSKWRNILKGLLFPESERRWGAKELDKWFRGEDVPLPAVEEGFYYRFAADAEARSPEQLASFMRKDPERARRHIAERTLIQGLMHQRREDLASDISSYVNRFVRPEVQMVAVLFRLDPIVPYSLAPGMEASDRKTMVHLIDSSDVACQAAKEHLFDGRLPAWLIATGQEEAANLWYSNVEKYREREDEGMEYFLHILDPDLAMPVLSLRPDNFNNLVMRPDQPGEFHFSILNTGRGYLSGTLSLLQSDPYFRIEPNFFSGARTDFILHVNTASMVTGQVYESELEIFSNSSTPRLSRLVNVLAQFSKQEAWRIAAEWALLSSIATGIGFIGIRSLISAVVGSQNIWIIGYEDRGGIAILGGFLFLGLIPGVSFILWHRFRKVTVKTQDEH